MPNPSTLALEEEELSCQRYVTKDSGRREEFNTGARRDVQEGKPDFDLLPAAWEEALVLEAASDPDCDLGLVPVHPLVRLAALYGRGARKYGPHNYQKGIPLKRVYQSLRRHLNQWRRGDRSEDHLAAVAWNAFALIYYEREILAGRLPHTLDDLNLLPPKA